MQRVGVDAPGEHLAGRRHHGVVSACEAGDRIQKDQHVALVLDQPLGLLDHHLGDLDVARRGLVERRAHDLALDRALHVGDLLGTLVDQQHDEVDLGVVGRHRIGDVLHQHGLAGARRRGEQRPLSLAQRRDELDHAHAQVLVGRVLDLEVELLFRVERGEVVEVHAVARGFRIVEVDAVDLEQREVPLAVLGRTNLPLDGVAGAQRETANLARRDVDVVGARQVVGLRRAEEAEAVLEVFEHPVAVDRGVVVGEVLEDREHQVLLAQQAGVFDSQVLGVGEEVFGGFELELLKLHEPIVPNTRCGGARPTTGKREGSERARSGVTPFP